MNKPTYAMYWRKDHICSTPISSRIMHRDKFERIRKMLHFTDPFSEDPADSLSKLRGFLEKLGNSFRNNYTPNQNISVDEYLSLWKWKLKFRVYIPSKRERYGVKVYMLCKSTNGYLWSFIIYSGADMDYPPPSVDLTNFSMIIPILQK